MNTKLDQYRIFNEAAQALSFSKAAKNLYISQSAISQTITALEKELDTTLFVRHAKGVSLTKEGRLLYQETAQALSLIEKAENNLINLKELKGGDFVIGAPDTLCVHCLTPYLVKFRERYPLVHVRVVNGTSLETIKRLKSGQLDLAFVNLPFDDEAIITKPCLTVHDIFVSGHPDDHLYTYKELSHKKLIMLERLSNSRRYVDHIFAKEGIHLSPEMELGAHELLLNFAKNDLGISVVIKEFSQMMLDHQEIYELQLEKPLPERSIGYAYASRLSLSQAASKFIELLNNAA